MKLFQNQKVLDLIYNLTGIEDEKDLITLCNAIWSVVINHNKISLREIADYIGTDVRTLEKCLRRASETMYHNLSPETRDAQEIFRPLGVNQMLYVLASAVMMDGLGDFDGLEISSDEIVTISFLSGIVPVTQIRSRAAFRGLYALKEYILHIYKYDSVLTLTEFLKNRFGCSHPQYFKSIKLVTDAMQENPTEAGKELLGYYWSGPAGVCDLIVKAMKEEYQGLKDA